MVKFYTDILREMRYNGFRGRNMLDCVIVGSGPAGISAALTLKANGKSFALLGKKSLSAKIEKAEIIRNYPGLNSITGKDFCTALKWQLGMEEIDVLEQKVVGVFFLERRLLFCDKLVSRIATFTSVDLKSTRFSVEMIPCLLTF